MDLVVERWIRVGECLHLVACSLTLKVLQLRLDPAQDPLLKLVQPLGQASILHDLHPIAERSPIADDGESPMCGAERW